MEKPINKYMLKQELIKISNGLDEMAGKLMSPPCADNQTGELRSEAYMALSKLHEEINEMIYKIY